MHKIALPVLCVLAACGGPEPSDVFEEVRRGSVDCPQRIRQAFSEATWIEDFYSAYKADINALVAEAATHAVSVDIDFRSGGDSLTYSSSNQTSLTIGMSFGGHTLAYELDRIEDDTASRVELDAMAASTDVDFGHCDDDTVMRCSMPGNYSCSTPGLKFEVFRGHTQTRRTTEIAYVVRRDSTTYLLYGKRREDMRDYTGKACVDDECTGVSYFIPEGIDLKELGGGVPFVWPEFLSRLGPR